MKKFVVPFILFPLIYSCSSENADEKANPEKLEIADSDTLEIKTDSAEVAIEISTANYFRDFLSALQKKDFQQVETFISPNFSNLNNEIWYLALDGNDESVDLIGNETRPFTKKDWKKHYLNVFSKEFIETVRSLNLDEITKEEGIESDLFKNKKDKMNYKCRTYFADKKKQELVICLDLEIYQEDEDLYSESSHIFHFLIDESGRPLFVKFAMAG